MCIYIYAHTWIYICSHMDKNIGIELRLILLLFMPYSVICFSLPMPQNIICNNL